MKGYEKYDKNTIRVPRQEVAFLEKARKIGGCGSLKEDFYTRKLRIWGCDMAKKMNSISAVMWVLPECYLCLNYWS